MVNSKKEYLLRKSKQRYVESSQVNHLESMSSMAMKESVLNAVFNAQDIPQDWQNGLIVPLFKDGDIEVATNYRRIMLLGIVGKLFASIIERRLSRWCETNRYSSRSKLAFALAARQFIR